MKSQFNQKGFATPTTFVFIVITSAYLLVLAWSLITNMYSLKLAASNLQQTADIVAIRNIINKNDSCNRKTFKLETIDVKRACLAQTGDSKYEQLKQQVASINDAISAVEYERLTNNYLTFEIDSASLEPQNAYISYQVSNGQIIRNVIIDGQNREIIKNITINN